MARKFEIYKNGLLPLFKFLSDKAVIVQAWKKSHEYIRRHNWYSDTLDLDFSCIDLENLYLEISDIFSTDKWKNYSPTPLRLVPAPKPNENWKINSGKFIPPADLSIRPLAHISIKDQTIAMMFLMCLANIFENLQKKPAEYSKNDDNLAVSYGNRLLCLWEKSAEGLDKANFLWGNSETYNRYYEDYQNFISRPEKVLQNLVSSQKERQFLVITTDLSKCYDRIDCQSLIKKIQKEIVVHSSQEKKFLQCLKRIFRWEWDQADRNLIETYRRDLEDKTLEEENHNIGIPQGLVISGFLANIYLLDFDNKIKDLISAEQNICINDCSYTIIDYCRYVDDMRFVLRINTYANNIEEKNFTQHFSQYIQGILDQFASGQKINQTKTSLSHVDFSKNFNIIAEQLRELKFRTSGPMDEHNAWEVLKLNKNIWEYTSNPKKTDSISFGDIYLETKPIDVKEETLERFSAYNWRKVYRTLSLLLPPNNDNSDSFDYPYSRKTLDYQTDDFCQKILFRWLSDPSKIRILRISLDICPNCDYLQIVLELLCKLLGQDGYPKYYALYILSELYRAAAIETGFVCSHDQISDQYNIDDYRFKLRSKIPDIIKRSPNMPWYLANQIALFCFIFCYEDDCLKEVLPFCDNAYQECYKYMALSDEQHLDKINLPALITAYRIKKNDEILKKYINHLVLIGKNEYDIYFRQLITYIDNQLLFSLNICDQIYADENNQIIPNVDIPLLDIIKSKQNPFVSEVALLRLGLALWEFLEKKKISVKKFYSLQQLSINISSLTSINNPTKRCRLTISAQKNFLPKDRFLFQPEKWEDCDFAKISQIGKILRSAALSEQEYSLMRQSSLVISDEKYDKMISRYWGVRSSWLKRHYGLFFDRIALGGTHIPISPWFTNLFSTLLAWPGAWCFEEFENINFKELKNLFQQRLDDLKKCYGQASNQLIIPVDIDLNSFTNGSEYNKLNVALVQNIFPTKNDLDKDPFLQARENKSKSHSHLSDLFQMLLKAFKTQKKIVQKFKSINLIVFPELSITHSDLSAVERFADQMNCMVFCGTVFHTHPEDISKKVNTGMWIIPQRTEQHRSFIRLLQGKKHLTKDELKKYGISPYRPVQWLIRGNVDNKTLWSLSAAMCYDSTDIKLAADLRDVTDCFIVSAFNKDIGVFDTMAESMRYHMFGHIAIANCGMYGGSTVQAPYKEAHERIIVHSHGNMQASISLATLDLRKFSKIEDDRIKTPPAGYNGRHQ